jgi:hypothetical protein
MSGRLRLELSNQTNDSLQRIDYKMIRRASRRRREIRQRWNFRRRKPSILTVDCRIFTWAKLGEDEATNADRADFCQSRRRYMVADGVSRSFRPQVLAEYLVSSFVRSDLPLAHSSLETIMQLFTPWSGDGLSWPEAALLERFGSQSTFLAVDISQLNSTDFLISAIAVGDSVLALVNANDPIGLASVWPFQNVADFPSIPGTIGTSTPYIKGSAHGPADFTARQGDSLLLMTDAIGRYFARSCETGVSLSRTFPFLENDTGFADWANAAMTQGLVEEDDLTIMEIRFR